jgi:hypothetical protein
VFVDHRALYVGDLPVLGEAVDDERVQTVGVRNGDMDEEVTLRELRARPSRGGAVRRRHARAGQTSRVYDEYLDQLADTEPADIGCLAISLVGARNKVGKLIGRLPLLP